MKKILCDTCKNFMSVDISVRGKSDIRKVYCLIKKDLFNGIDPVPNIIKCNQYDKDNKIPDYSVKIPDVPAPNKRIIREDISTKKAFMNLMYKWGLVNCDGKINKEKL